MATDKAEPEPFFSFHGIPFGYGYGIVPGEDNLFICFSGMTSITVKLQIATTANVVTAEKLEVIRQRLLEMKERIDTFMYFGYPGASFVDWMIAATASTCTHEIMPVVRAIAPQQGNEMTKMAEQWLKFRAPALPIEDQPVLIPVVRPVPTRPVILCTSGETSDGALLAHNSCCNCQDSIAPPLPPLPLLPPPPPPPPLAKPAQRPSGLVSVEKFFKS